MRSQYGAMPGWLKIILIVIVVGIVGVIALGVVGVNWIMGSVSPENASKVAQSMVKIKEPLPDGWSYLMGMEIVGTKLASIKNADGTALVQFMEIPNPKKQTAEQILSDQELNNVAQSGAPTQIEKESSGTTWIGGEKVYYIRGKLTQKGQTSAMEMGAVVMPSGKTILIQEMEPREEKFDPALTKPIINAIDGFKM